MFVTNHRASLELVLKVKEIGTPRAMCLVKNFGCRRKNSDLGDTFRSLTSKLGHPVKSNLMMEQKLIVSGSVTCLDRVTLEQCYQAYGMRHIPIFLLNSEDEGQVEKNIKNSESIGRALDNQFLKTFFTFVILSQRDRV